MEDIGNFKNAKKVMDTCKNSQLVLVSRKQHIKLAPKYIGNIQKGVRKQLAALLSHPDKVFDGFPLAYNNVRVIQCVGKMVSDQTCVHFDIQADFIMFKPIVGCKLSGKVNKVAKRHIGCLVHNNFNAWVPHTAGTEKINADSLMGSEIEFTIQEISTNRNVLSIKGKFEKFLSQKMQKKMSAVVMKPNQHDKTAISNVTGLTMNGDTMHDSEEVSSPTTKKKKKHRKDEPSQDESVVDEAGYINDSVASLGSCEPLFTSTQIDGLNNNYTEKVKEKKRKKKKAHDREDKPDDSLLDLSAGSSIDATEESAIEDISKRGMEDSRSTQGLSNSRKRRHEENKFTKLKGTVTDSDLAVPSPVKRSKKHKKKALETFDFDSSVDFEDSSKIAKKEKKKKKHKEKAD